MMPGFRIPRDFGIYTNQERRISMDWYQELYIGETVKNRQQEIIRKVELEQRLSKVLLIITASGEQNQLEILNTGEYYKQRKRTGDGLIVGIAGSGSEAAQLVRQMTEDVYLASGNANLRDYFIQKQKG